MVVIPSERLQQRPDLSQELMPSEFLSWYWLKGELVEFCRLHGISASGSKLDVAARIEAFLADRPIPKPEAAKRFTRKMPITFNPQTRIESGWRCGPLLNAYFRTTLGKGFRFNKTIRDFIHTQAGKTLLEAEHCYLRSIRAGACRPISKQLEYNQHFRNYYTAHPGATRQEVIDAWWRKRSTPKGT